jgi:hypothetical protein
MPGVSAGGCPHNNHAIHIELEVRGVVEHPVQCATAVLDRGRTERNFGHAILDVHYCPSFARNRVRSVLESKLGNDGVVTLSDQG